MKPFIPIAIGVVVLLAATAWQAQIVDRFGESDVTAEHLKSRFDLVPKKVGPWMGEDQEVTKDVLETAGAVGHVNRIYTNQETGQQIALWLIVGHAKDVVRHTPDVCMPAAGLRQAGDKIKRGLDFQDGTQGTFWTARFDPSVSNQPASRMFWAWATPPEKDSSRDPVSRLVLSWLGYGDDGDENWSAPNSPRVKYGNTKALYKMYFTAAEINDEDAVDKSPCLEFAKVFVPRVDQALFGGQTPAASSNQGSTQSAAAERQPAPQSGA